VLLNLLNNAFYAVTHQKNHAPTIIVSAEKTSDNHIEIAVVDSGLGIPPELRTKIFEPFFTTKVAGEGTGLGLSISKNLVISNEGDLYLDTSSERTRFCMSFPIKSDK
jgi:two-component system NtrC family sensor kinase